MGGQRGGAEQEGRVRRGSRVQKREGGVRRGFAKGREWNRTAGARQGKWIPEALLSSLHLLVLCADKVAVTEDVPYPRPPTADYCLAFSVLVSSCLQLHCFLSQGKPNIQCRS